MSEDLDAIAADHPGVLKAIARELLVSLSQSRERFMETKSTYRSFFNRKGISAGSNSTGITSSRLSRK